LKVVYLLLTGVVVAGIDVFPMFKKRLDRFSIWSAIIFHMIMPFIVYSMYLEIPWVLKGGIVYFACSIPISILVLKEDKNAFRIIMMTSAVLGCFVGYLCGFVYNL